jgi:acyl dehydratase
MSQLPVYTVTARNTAADSENKMHDDRVASEFGFRGGLVPGVTVYAYMTAPIVGSMGLDWLERGSMKVRFLQPFYDGEPVVVRAEMTPGPNSTSVQVRAERETGEQCATGEAGLSSVPGVSLSSPIEETGNHSEAPSPPAEQRLPATREALKPGTVFGAIEETLDLASIAASLLGQIEERLPVYYGPSAHGLPVHGPAVHGPSGYGPSVYGPGPVAHPITLLSLANRILVENVKLGPWIHAGSDLVNYHLAYDGETITVRGRIHDSFERKGHEFVVLDLILSSGEIIVQKVRHTAIYTPRKPEKV